MEQSIGSERYGRVVDDIVRANHDCHHTPTYIVTVARIVL